MRSLPAWIISALAAVCFLLLARSKNLFVEQNAYTLYGLFVAAFFAPTVIAFVWADRPWRWAIPIVVGILVGDVAAIRRDLFKDSTSHIQWPVELGLLAVVVSVCALAGAFTGAHVRKRRRKSENGAANRTATIDS